MKVLRHNIISKLGNVFCCSTQFFIFQVLRLAHFADLALALMSNTELSCKFALSNSFSQSIDHIQSIICYSPWRVIHTVQDIFIKEFFQCLCRAGGAVRVVGLVADSVNLASFVIAKAKHFYMYSELLNHPFKVPKITISC